MAEALDDELARLRARAYGADADIEDDPVALARLRELEQQRQRPTLIGQRVAPSPPPERAPTGLDAPPPPPLPLPPLLPLPPGSAAAAASVAGAAPQIPAPPEDSPRNAAFALSSLRTWRVRGARAIAVAAVGALVALAIAVPATLWASGSTDRPYAILQATDEPPNEAYLGPGAVRYDEFLGMRVTVGSIDGIRGRCMVIELAPSNDPDDMFGSTQGGCSAPGFEPIFDVAVDRDVLSPEALDQLGDATGIRFAFVAGEVRVYLASAPAPSEGS